MIELTLQEARDVLFELKFLHVVYLSKFSINRKGTLAAIELMKYKLEKGTIQKAELQHEAEQELSAANIQIKSHENTIKQLRANMELLDERFRLRGERINDLVNEINVLRNVSQEEGLAE